jgi:modulator of FtsH protease
MFIVGIYGLMFLTNALKNSPLGLVSVFAFTGFMGYSIGPILSFYIAHYSNGPQLVTTALAMIASIFFQIPALSLAISAAFVLISSGLILFQTSEIIHGGETNYISATVSLFVSIYNLFLSLLNLLGAFSGRD